MEHSEVERIVSYIFRNKNLLEEALTQDSPSYQRLLFLGESVIANAISNHLFLSYPQLEPGHLTLLKAATTNTEKLASVAVRCRLYQHLKRNAASVDDEVREFTNAICKGDPVAHGGSMKAPKVLADIVKSLAAAIYVDLNCDLYGMWLIFKHMLEPIVTPKDLQQQPQPVPASRALPTLNNGPFEIYMAKCRLNEICSKRKWPKPNYSIEKDIGPSHDKKFVSLVQVASPEGILRMIGDEKSRVKDADNSAASVMIRALEENNYL